MLRWFLRIVVLVVSFWSPAAALAADAAAAQAAFDAAMELMEAGRYPEACAKFEESMKIEAGMATQFRLAECYEKDNRIASAWKNYDAVAAAARVEGMVEREAFAMERANAILPRVSYLAIQVPAQVAQLEGLAVTVDGVLVQPAGWGRVAVDVGTHRIEAGASGKKAFVDDVAVDEEGAIVTVRVPALEDAPREGEAPGTAVAPASPAESPDIAPLVAGVAMGGVGIIAMAAGIGVGFAAKSRHEESAPFCEGDFCHPEGLAIRDDARTIGNVGTGLFVAGALVAAGGLVVVLTSPTLHDEMALELGVAPSFAGAGMTLGGSF